MFRFMRENLAFKEGVPSLFILTSPLQVICALEAINKFKIKDYQVVLVLVDDVRNSQVFELCKQFGIHYEIEMVLYPETSFTSCEIFTI